MIDYEGKAWASVLGRVRGTILPRVLARVVAGALIGAIATYLHRAYGVVVPAIGHSLVGAALGLLLVFRTNASYERYWEGRRLVGSIVNRGRDFVRQVATLIPGHDEQLRRMRRDLRRWMVGFFVLASDQLRGVRDLEARADLFEPSERVALETRHYRPAVLLAWMARTTGEALSRSGLPAELVASRQREIDENIGNFYDYLGGCERIRSTPVPFAYAHHIKLFVFLFCYSVPFVMADTMGWLTPVASAIVCFALFGIDEIAVEIEDPFGTDANDLPMERLARNIDESTREILEAIERAEDGAEARREAA